ncbi:MAG: TetR/AcrR family transcriptional regulator [Desulfobacula sp.]|nr:TetR/AcrR family transcriptional regulator [Desulfobacula sp.]
MAEKEKKTEQAILEAAKKVFISKGMDGARMQEIADEAGINKSLLHYYFRSKDKLFQAVFHDSFFKFLPNLVSVIQSQLPVTEKLKHFSEHYIEILLQNPEIPIFILSEISRNPSRIVEMLKNTGINPEFFAFFVQKEIEEGKIRDFDPRHLIVNILAMCIFPFVGRPILQHILFKGDNEAFEKFLEERKSTVPDFIENAIRIK